MMPWRKPILLFISHFFLVFPTLFPPHKKIFLNLSEEDDHEDGAVNAELGVRAEVIYQRLKNILFL